MGIESMPGSPASRKHVLTCCRPSGKSRRLMNWLPTASYTLLMTARSPLESSFVTSRRPTNLQIGTTLLSRAPGEMHA